MSESENDGAVWETVPPEGIDLNARLQALERSLIEQALAMTAGNVSETARLMRIGRTTLHERMIKLGIRPRAKYSAVNAPK